jgi:hypothetical protein
MPLTVPTNQNTYILLQKRDKLIARYVTTNYGLLWFKGKVEE